MSNARYIRDEIWDDNWFFPLTATEKLVWLYLLTNRRCNVAGVFKLNIVSCSTTLGIEENVLRGVLKKFEGGKKVFLFDDWVFITNFYKHQTKSPKITAGVKRILEELPREFQEALIGYDRLSIGYRTLLNLTLLNLTLLNGEPALDQVTVFFEEEKHDVEDLRLTNLLISLIQRNNPAWQMRGNIDTWANHIEKLRRIDKRTPNQIEYMIRWTQNDSFWQQNILSTAKLRQQFNDLIPKLKASMVKAQNQKLSDSKPKMV